MNWIGWTDPIKRIEVQIKELGERYRDVKVELSRLQDDVRTEHLNLQKAVQRRDATEVFIARQRMETLGRVIAVKRATLSQLWDAKTSLEQEVAQTKHAKDLKSYTKVIALSNSVGPDPVKLDLIVERYDLAMNGIKDKQSSLLINHSAAEYDQSDAAILQNAEIFLKQYEQPAAVPLRAPEPAVYAPVREREPAPVMSEKELEAIANLS